LKMEYSWLFSVSLGMAYAFNQAMQSQHKGNYWPSFQELFNPTRFGPNRRKQTFIDTMKICIVVVIFTLPLWKTGPEEEHGEESSHYATSYAGAKSQSDQTSYSSSYAHRSLTEDGEIKPTNGLSSVELSGAGALLMVLGAVLEGMEHSEHGADDNTHHENHEDSLELEPKRSGDVGRLAARLSSSDTVGPFHAQHNSHLLSVPAATKHSERHKAEHSLSAEL
jgi:hypothetical protein